MGHIRPDFTKHLFSDSVLKNLQAKVLYSTCRTISVCKLFQIVNFDVCEFTWFDILTVLVLFNQSDYLNHSKLDSDWLIVVFFMRVYLKIKFV